MKTPEPDHRLVDYLYDEMPASEREAFAAELDRDPAAAEQVASLSSMLQLYRAHSDEVQPSPETSANILAAAAKAAPRPSLWSRLFGGGLGLTLLRPAFAMTAVAVIAVGLGAFVLLKDHDKPARGPDARSPGPGAAMSAGDRPVSGDEVAGTGSADPAAPTAATPGPSLSDTAKTAPAFEPRAGEDKREALAQATTKRKKARRSRARRAGAPLDDFKREGALSKDKAPPAIPRASAPRRPVAKSSSSSGRAIGGLFGGNKGDASLDSGQGGFARDGSEQLKRGVVLLRRNQLASACAAFRAAFKSNAGAKRVEALRQWAHCELRRGNNSQANRLALMLSRIAPKLSSEANSIVIAVKRRNSRLRVARRLRRAKRAAPKAKPRARPASRTLDTLQTR